MAINADHSVVYIDCHQRNSFSNNIALDFALVAINAYEWKD